MQRCDAGGGGERRRVSAWSLPKRMQTAVRQTSETQRSHSGTTAREKEGEAAWTARQNNATATTTAHDKRAHSEIGAA